MPFGKAEIGFLFLTSMCSVRAFNYHINFVHVCGALHLMIMSCVASGPEVLHTAVLKHAAVMPVSASDLWKWTTSASGWSRASVWELAHKLLLAALC